MPVIVPLNTLIAKLQNDMAELRLKSDSCFTVTGAPVSIQQLYEFNGDITVSVFVIRNTIQSIANSFNAAGNQLSDAEKHALWNLLFESCQLIDKNISRINHAVEIAQLNSFTFAEALKGAKQNLDEISDFINAMNFKITHLYRRDLQPIEVSSKIVNISGAKGQTTKPGFFSKLITRLCVKAVTTVGQKEEDIARSFKSTLLDAPNDVRNYQLRIDKKTLVQTVEYLNPQTTDKWLIAVGGAGAAYTDMLPVAKEIAMRNNYNFLVVDYLAEKTTSFAEPVKIILAAANFLLEQKGAKLENLALVGHSNGGRVVLETAAHLPGCNVVTNNTYTSIEDVILSSVKHPSESLPNLGVPASACQYSAELLNTISSFLEKHQLDKKIAEVVQNALEATNSGYQAEQAKSKIPDHRYAAVYTAPCTEHDDSGNKLLREGGDKLLFEAVDARIQAKKAKQALPEHYAALKQRNKFFSRDEGEIIGVKCKDSPNPARKGHHLVFKGITQTEIKNTHNVIDADLLGSALDELEKQKNHKPLTMQEHMERLLEKYDLTHDMEYLLPPTGVEFTSSERFFLLKVMAQLKKDPYQAGMPTQIQLMRLFQANDVAAEMISAYKPALDKMIWGDNATEYKKGTEFLKKRLNTLADRTVAPNPCLGGVGSYINKHMADTILERLQNYHAKLPYFGHGLFSGQSPTELVHAPVKKRERLKQHITVSDLDLTRVLPCGMVGA